MYNLEEYQKINGKYVNVRTHIYNCPYPICKGKKNQLESTKNYYSYFKIIKN